MPEITIVVGTGISAAAYLATMRRQLGQVRVLGGAHLWERMAPDHAMGQPAPLLRGNLLSGSRQYADPARDGFMSSRAFEQLVTEQIHRNAYCQFPGSMVTEIRRVTSNGYKYRLSVDYDGARYFFFCHRLILASGPGPARPLTIGDDGSLEVNPAAFAGHVVGGNDFMEPNWRSPWRDTRGKVVAVYGGSATAAWAVELAALRGMRVACWFTRPGSGGGAWDADARFRDAFPAGGRNAEVQRDYQNVRRVLKLTDIKLLRPRYGPPALGLKFLQSNGDIYWHVVDLLIYALGAAHTAATGIRATLDADLEGRLVAFYDRNGAISSRPCLLAIGTSDQSFMIVGSAMSSRAGFGDADLQIQQNPARTMGTLASYAQISSTLPPSARPTEGIAMVMASIEALNDYMPISRSGGMRFYRTPDLLTQSQGRGTPNPRAGILTVHDTQFEWDINVNTSNRTQLAALLAQTTDLRPFAANIAVALIVCLRQKSTFGLTTDQVLMIVDVAKAAEEVHRGAGMDGERFEIETRMQNGVDQYLDLVVNHLTTGEFVQFWETRGIACR